MALTEKRLNEHRFRKFRSLSTVKGIDFTLIMSGYKIRHTLAAVFKEPIRHTVCAILQKMKITKGVQRHSPMLCTPLLYHVPTSEEPAYTERERSDLHALVALEQTGG